ncbi:DUF1624 domain-containing protein [Bermanella marisrubri]|uniref:Heparan-alpha-glucosaminide N-acetyltransferase catalytic domain-containing protein n=1 Tax=Bermanella marisrubri TaxID=207949 RepID=Q1N2D3_9GAMM|nr:heparan-alpha-glucosaminide N-acetyltransferase domain-containing protein [Bermanella marisrubri]EAT12474.1 hypothetical protein RED65_16591 [Oceanobacter sp. RED65] [Bermanella marisrubri]QIZ85551.1 DUF1624 domain-containing protein [Bermanella marisrubri]
MEPLASTKFQRVKEIDFGRGIAVFLMIFVHTLWMYADAVTQYESLFGHVIHTLGKGTSAFLVLMGMSLILAHSSLKDNLVRALLLLALGYFMNFLKFIVPISLFGTMPESFIEAYGWNSPLETWQYFYLLSTGDILQLAGISLLIIAVIKKYFDYGPVYFSLGLFIMLTSQWLRGLSSDISELQYLNRLLFSDHYQVYFPVFPWMSFILFGMFMGKIYVRMRNQLEQFYHYTFISAIILIVLGFILAYANYEYHIANFFHHGPGGTLYLMGITLLLYWVIYRLVRFVQDGPIIKGLEYLSKNVTSLYIIQWTLICWGMGIVGFQTLNAWQTLAMMPVMLCLTLLAQVAINQCKSTIKRLMSKPINHQQKSLKS